MMPPPIAVTLAAARERDHRDRLAALEPVCGGIEGEHRSDRRSGKPGRAEGERAAGADQADEGLDGYVGNSDQDARGRPEQYPVMVVGRS